MLSSDAIIDQRTGQLSLINIIDQVTVDQLPAGVQNISFTTFWTRSDATDEELTVVGRLAREPEIPNEIRGLDKPEFEIKFLKGTRDARLILTFGGIILNDAGDNHFIFEIKENEDWIEAGRIRLNVVHAPDPSNINRSPALSD